jgi:spore coat protein U-like protein
MKRIILAAAALSLSLAAAPASADTANGNLTVTATVSKACTVSSPTLALGVYSPTVAPTTSNIDIVVTCTNGTGWSLVLDSNRQMTGPSGATLNFQLSDTLAGTTFPASVARTGTGAADPVKVYGRVVANQFAAAGSYTGNVAITVTY